MDTTLTDKELLLKAADVMERFGWCSGMLQNGEGEVCLMGAMNIALGRLPVATDAYRHPAIPLLVEKLSLKLHNPEYSSDPFQTAISWNNRQTSGQPVIDGLRRVAASL